MIIINFTTNDSNSENDDANPETPGKQHRLELSVVFAHKQILSIFTYNRLGFVQTTIPVVETSRLVNKSFAAESWL